MGPLLDIFRYVTMSTHYRQIILGACVVGALVSLFSVNARAAMGDHYQTGNDILRMCQAKNAADVTQCLGYLEGSADAWAWVTCIPQAVEAGQLEDVVTRYLTENVTERQNPAAELVLIAVNKAWPCPKTPTKK